MVKTITIMDDAYEALKKKKIKEESFSDTIRRMCHEKKIDWDRWFGILKSDEIRVREMHSFVKDLRGKTSRDIAERIQKAKKHVSS